MVGVHVVYFLKQTIVMWWLSTLWLAHDTWIRERLSRNVVWVLEGEREGLILSVTGWEISVKAHTVSVPRFSQPRTRGLDKMSWMSLQAPILDPEGGWAALSFTYIRAWWLGGGRHGKGSHPQEVWVGNWSKDTCSQLLPEILHLIFSLAFQMWECSHPVYKCWFIIQKLKAKTEHHWVSGRHVCRLNCLGGPGRGRKQSSRFFFLGGCWAVNRMTGPKSASHSSK